ncbi:MAG TPA: sigma-70 family RNA polymerase sigma factor [Pirellulales bacterium]|nr:sigma-70 family RNA polymerase sigma factor [Pirellulales bacterium]
MAVTLRQAMQTTSISLLRRLQHAGTDQDWRRFVGLYTPLLFHWVRQTGLRPPDDADLVQDVFALLVEKLPLFDYDAKQSFRGWLQTVVRNKVRDRLRRKSLPQEYNPAELAKAVDAMGEPDGGEREHQMFLAATALRIMRSEFHETTWKACWEFVVGGRPAAEIAAELGISENGVYVAKCRVMRRLRKELAGMLD